MIHSVHSFLPNPPKSANCPSQSIPICPRQLLPIYWFFMNLPRKKKKLDFSRNPWKIKVFGNPSYLLKVTKFLVKISQCKFLVMTEKNIFVYKPFLSLNISDFRGFFNVKIATLLRKVTPLFPSNLL